jgi:hypothetical protein
MKYCTCSRLAGQRLLNMKAKQEKPHKTKNRLKKIKI